MIGINHVIKCSNLPLMIKKKKTTTTDNGSGIYRTSLFIDQIIKTENLIMLKGLTETDRILF